MGIYIEDINKPESCAVCFMSDNPKDELYCPFSKIEALNNHIVFHCPIWKVETPHGSLIDFDTIYFVEDDYGELIARFSDLKDVPSVIKAERE